MSDPKQFFTVIYNDGLWRMESDESRSGEGSTLQAAGPIIREIPELLRLLSIKSMLDIPCGDFKWMQLVDRGQTHYLGADIVEPLIEDNNKAFGRDGVKFQVLDLVAGPLPKVDLILCRDCFIHLTIPMVMSALDSIVKSESTYLLTSHYPWRAYSNNDEVDDLIIGGRRINLEVAPFGFPPPLHSIPEGEKLPIAADKSLCLWKIEDLKEPLRSSQARYRKG
jgi:hypothetical protein